MHKAVLMTMALAMLGNGNAMAQHQGRDRPESAFNDAERDFVRFSDTYLQTYKPLQIASSRAKWEASITGSDEAFQRRKEAETALLNLHSDRMMFGRIQSFKNEGRIRDPILKRQLDIMYYQFLPNQADPALRKQIIALEADVEQIFNTHRSLIDGRPSTENDVREILAGTLDSSEAEKAWTGYMAVGAKVESKLKELVLLRNRISRDLGFGNFFAMNMALQEIDEVELFKLFDELDALTREPFARLKRGIDEKMSARFRIPPSELRPWHFGDLFFQEAPCVQDVNLDDALRSQNMVDLARKYFAGLGMPVDDILRRSDLYEKPGKSPHAFCSDLDREGDIRILCNLAPNTYWMDTLMHELGHAVYEKYISPDLPFNLRKASHGITTEGIALMFGSMVKNEEWLVKVVALPADEVEPFAKAARELLRAEKIIFSRWAQVMTRFEHGMYENPDRNLGQLWWDLRKRYQLLNPPDDVNRPDYGAKMHVVATPAYYHCYLMGDLFASQVHSYISTRVLGVDNPGTTGFFGRQEAGNYLREKIFACGRLYPWHELVRLATGEPLTAKYFSRQYVD